MSRAGDDGRRIDVRQHGGLASPVKKNATLGTKFKRWRGFQAEIGLQAAPVLEFY